MSFFPVKFDVDVLSEIVFSYLWSAQKEMWLSQAVASNDHLFLIWSLKWIQDMTAWVAQDICLMDNPKLLDCMPHEQMYILCRDIPDETAHFVNFCQKSSLRAFRAFVRQTDNMPFFMFLAGLKCCRGEQDKVMHLISTRKTMPEHGYKLSDLCTQPAVDVLILNWITTFVSDSEITHYVCMYGFQVPEIVLQSWLPRIQILNIFLYSPSYKDMQLGQSNIESLQFFKKHNLLDPRYNSGIFWRAVKTNDVIAAQFFFSPDMLRDRSYHFLSFELSFEMLYRFVDYLDDLQYLPQFSSSYTLDNASKDVVNDLMLKLSQRQDCNPRDIMHNRWELDNQDVLLDWFYNNDRQYFESMFNNCNNILA